ncbi:brain-specific angiogenesis inhibitor 1-associated protein 2-like protein 2 isoform X2 [Oreochromis aureus]|uniref:brain-specific angiogenesis inhibitor 1-associated protein 2-like protein 2 isoform X2 n=1 Tax=Oreochromis aureus TaxID=47969 RepID=UPI001953D3DF|nr:brain-specific angiogenesis inhibitor 1-associated protein 2-like protein 2 isoform X2 [Oreochromis aureus]
MSGMNSDQLHRSTLGIYSSLINEFNPGLQKLVSLGNSYIQAFKALAATSDAYFSALSKVGERAFHTASSRSIGDVLIQVSESQRRLVLELEGVFRSFSLEVLDSMEKNVRLDREYLLGSRETYEMQLRSQAAALERLRRRPSQAYPQGGSEYVDFLRESHNQALQEEERRYRFLAEKHCGLIESFTKFMNKNGVTLQQQAAAWTEEVDATRRPEAHRPATLDNIVGMREEEIRRSRDEMPLGKIPSRAPSPQGSVFRFGADSAGGGGGGGGGGGRVMKARVAHQPAGSNPTLLTFNRGQIINVLVQQPRNGWLFGRADNSPRQGWFPASFVEAVDDPPVSPAPRTTLRSNSSMNSLPVSSQSGAAPPPPPPPPPLQSPSLNKPQSSMNMAPPMNSNLSNSENKRSQVNDSRPQLFPKGTNPFATVKLKPTSTNDRSAPRLYRR